ncbi:methyltransferase family protein [Halococcus morrhuae DSM 1307]|uniref:Methyltransferase family protein n=1 Tax=Halococcus morrhuae DSM 1307 TaxID=931277 RepID=M0MH62_HALMO|nr:methyltransferase domain-containing protein [Halococcus morrhuae]EMA45041.1 methyltransferase family protein [Halococcus morrhuae DSM 1307]
MCAESALPTVTRDAILRKWVRQPPTTPLIQQLRDEERQRALAELDGGRVLDLASEANVTRGVSADSLTRVDFSDDASSYASETIGDAVDEYQSADPERPTLPFADDAFDAAVSIGPYDWKFLDVESLTAEVGRVLDDSDGKFVFSVPTPRSPYAANGWPDNHYYEPREALSLLAPDWRLLDADLVFQYPYYVHMALNTLPANLQEPFVGAAERASDELTARGRWNDASYLVLAAEPLNYRGYLDDALDCLFRPVDENGFWDMEDEKILRGLDYEIASDDENPEFEWTPDDRELWRYAPFGLMGALQWRVSALGTDRYDDELRSALDYFADEIESGTLSAMPSYGIGPLVCAFSLAAEVFDATHERVAWELFEHSRERFDFTHAEDSLLAYGWSYLAERESGSVVREALSEALALMNDRLTPGGLFVFDNHTTRRHQNQMYACWGFARAIEVTGQTGYLENVERVLERTVDERMRDDGAFVWEDEISSIRRARRSATKRLGFRPPYWNFLYECHQTFFVNAVAHYEAAGGERDFDREVSRAMAWIYGDSSRGDLVELSELGVPMRFLTVDDGLDVDDQMYKGSYEIGSYLMALTNLLAEP